MTRHPHRDRPIFSTLPRWFPASGAEDVIARLLYGPHGTHFEFHDHNGDRMVDPADIVAAQ